MGKSLIPEGKWSRMTLLWSFIQFIIMSLIEIIIIYRNYYNKIYYNNYYDRYLPKSNEEYVEIKKYLENYYALIVYQFLFIVAMAYQLYLTVDTLLKFSTIDLIGLSIYNTVCLGYSVTQYYQSKEIIYKLKSKMPGIVSYDNTMIEYLSISIMFVFVIGWWYITLKLYKIFGWNVFKQIGADVRLKQRLKLFNILITLLKYTSFFIFLFVTQYIVLALEGIKDNGKKLNELTIPVIVIIGTFFGMLAVAKVSRIYLGIYIFSLCALVGFVTFILVDIYKESDNKYSNSKISLSVTSYCTIVISLVTYVISIINFKNFGLGIPKSINKNTVQNGQIENNQQKRLSID